jgi:hypothetical protein
MKVHPPPAQPVFTPHFVWNSLREVRKLGSKPLPGKDDAVYSSVAQILTRLDNLWNNERGEASEKEQSREKIAEAITTLVELLPSTRADLEAEWFIASRCMHFAQGYLEDTRRDLALIDALIAAATEVQKRGLPLADIDYLAPRVEGGSDLIRQLERILSSLLPRVGTGERHRFIALVVELITGEALKEVHVRDRIRKPPVNTGK